MLIGLCGARSGFVSSGFVVNPNRRLIIKPDTLCSFEIFFFQPNECRFGIISIKIYFAHNQNHFLHSLKNNVNMKNILKNKTNANQIDTLKLSEIICWREINLLNGTSMRSLRLMKKIE